MPKYVFKTAAFLKSAVSLKGCPVLKDDRGLLLPEIAVIGRSNVGKSSLLNHLFRQRKLVKTSSTPGKTRELNFFLVDQSLCFADLPGYGYAKVPNHVRRKWEPMIQDYLAQRSSLRVILWLLDIRRTPTEEDLQILQWLSAHDKAVILVLTKTDKLTKNQRQANTQRILRLLNSENLHHVSYSVPKNLGRQDLIHMINEALIDEMEAITP